MFRFTTASFLLLAAGSAFGQSFNVDLNRTTGVGAGVPSASFAGASGQAGTWNDMNSSVSSITLKNLDGTTSTAQLTRSGGGTFFEKSNPAVTGDFEKLMEDAHELSSTGTLTYTFSNLQAGTYAVYVYGACDSFFAYSPVNVTGSTSMADQEIGTDMSANDFFVGATHSLHVKSVTAGGSLVITVGADETMGPATVAGIQIVKLPASLLRIHVNDNAPGLNNGASWSDAFIGLTEALLNARHAGGANVEVWVGSGFYEPTSTPDRYASFDIPDKVKLYGGFVGTETDLGQRLPWGIFLTYLSGDIGTNGLHSDNAYTVVDAANCSAETLMDGFFIVRGYNNDGGISGGKGAGMRLQNSSITLRNCRFLYNEATVSGGAIYSDQGSPTLINCYFYQNECFEGSAVFHADPNPIRMVNCDFIDNYGFEGTVAIDNTDATIMNSFFHGNYAGSEGGAVHVSGSAAQVTIANCTIVGNDSGEFGGGVYVQALADVTLSNSILWYNNAAFEPDMLDRQYVTDGQIGSTVTVNHTTAQGASGSAGLDPMFVDANGADNVWGTTDDNPALAAGSPAIDAGSVFNIAADFGDLDRDLNTIEATSLDFRFENRRIDDPDSADAGTGGAPLPDRGCVEFVPPVCVGDLDEDGDIDSTDLNLLLTDFNCSGGSCIGDIDGDGDTDSTDLNVLLSVFGDPC